MGAGPELIPGVTAPEPVAPRWALWKDSVSLTEPLPASLTAAAAMLPPPSEQALSELLARKEEEWRALQAHRAQLQEAALRDAQRRLEEAEGRLRRLQEDFVYNLQLLEERDRELESYDTAFAQAQRLQEARQAEASELKIEAAKLRQALASEARRREELQQQHQLKLQEHRLALERAHRWDTRRLPHPQEQAVSHSLLTRSCSRRRHQAVPHPGKRTLWPWPVWLSGWCQPRH